jgi:hypothetical protein
VFREHQVTYGKLALYSLLQVSVLPLPYAELCRFARAQQLDTEQESWRTKMTAAVKRLFRCEVKKFWQAVHEVPLCKLVGFGWNALYWLLTIPTAIVGSYLVVRHRPWTYSILLFGTIGYFAVTTSLAMAGDGMQRYRLRLLPYLYTLSAVGLTVCTRYGSPQSLNSDSSKLTKA